MAIINAAANGLWSSSTTWPGGVFPNGDDDVFANNRTIYIDQDITVKSLNTTAGAGGVAGGRFYSAKDDLRVNASVYAGTTFCLTLTGTGSKVLSGDFFRGSDTTTSTAGVYMVGSTTAPVSLSSYGVTCGGNVAGSNAGNTIAGILAEGGNLTHYGFVSGGTVGARNVGIKIYNGGGALYPVNVTVYGAVKGGQVSNSWGMVCEYVPAAQALSASSITVYGDLSGGDSLLTSSSINAGLYTITSIPTMVYGNLYGGSGFSYANGGIYTGGTTPVNISIIGNVTNSLFGSSPGLYIGSTTGSISITGNVISVDSLGINAASNAFNTPGIYVASTTTLNVYGNVYGCDGVSNYGGVGIFIDQPNTTNIYGNVYGGNAGNAYGVYTQDPGIINVVGDVYGSFVGRGPNGHGIYNFSTGQVNITGSAIASDGFGSYGVWNNAAGMVRVKRVVGNSYGVGSGVDTDNPGYGVYSVSISGMCFVEELVFGTRGQIPVFGPTYLTHTTTNSVTGWKFNIEQGAVSLGPKVMVDGSTVETYLPPVSSVRGGVVYNNNSLTGTMNIPPVSSVLNGVPVDNTVGTEFLTPQEFWSTQTTELTSLSTTVGFRLKDAATVESTGNILAAYNI